MRTKKLAIVCILFFLSFCSPSAPELHDFKFVGKVTDGNTGAGIADVLIMTGGQGAPDAHTYSDGNGRYSLNFRTIYSPEHFLMARKDGYHGSWGAGSDDEWYEDTEKTQTVNFKLYPFALAYK